MPPGDTTRRIPNIDLPAAKSFYAAAACAVRVPGKKRKRTQEKL